MQCFSFSFCASRSRDRDVSDVRDVPLYKHATTRQQPVSLQSSPHPSVKTIHSPSVIVDSPFSSSSPSLPPTLGSHLPSVTVSPSHTATLPSSSLPSFQTRYSVDLTSAQPPSSTTDEALKATFTTPLPTRPLFPHSVPALSPSPDTDTASSSSSQSSASPPPPPTQPMGLPPPHPRRSSPVTQHSIPSSRPHSTSISSSSPLHRHTSSNPSTPTYPPPQPPHPSSTPLRARRLQRHRALSLTSPQSSLFPRHSHITTSPVLSSFFQSSSSASTFAARLVAGVIVLHHEAEQSTWRHIFASPSLTRLHYVDLNAPPSTTAIPTPHLLSSTLLKSSRGLSTRSFIHKQTTLIDTNATPLHSPHLLSLTTPTLTLDLELGSEVERDEWWLTFDWLIWRWNEGKEVRGVEGRRGSWLGGLVGLYEQQDRMLRQAKGKCGVSEGVSGVSVERKKSASMKKEGRGVVLSDAQLSAVMEVMINDIEAVREANRALLVEDCGSFIDMQRRIDDLRQENMRLIEDIRPAIR